MLSKLIKYDFRDQGRMQWPLQLGVILGGILSGFCMAYLVNTLLIMGQEGELRAMQIVMFVAIFLLMTIVAASAIITQLLVGRQYYQSCFCDEGYLTFTLPVSTTKVLLSKLITGSVWVAVNLAAVVISMVLFVWIGFSLNAQASAQLAEGIVQLKGELAQFAVAFNIPWFICKYVLLLLLSAVSSVVMVDFVVTLGNQLAKKHKILCAVGIYFLISFVISAITGAAGGAVMMMLLAAEEFDWNSYMSSLNGLLAVSFIISIAATAVMYYFTDRMLKTKLNLE